MTATRRLAAILAADVAGYSRLMGADEEGTHERLKGHLRELVEPKIAEHRGRIVKNTGDGFLAEFGSVVDAVRCAVEIQRGMANREPDMAEERRIRFRIGVNLGDVIVEEHDIFGDGVNVAARLEGLAEPGGICVSRMVRDQIRDKLDFAFEDLGEQSVKNIARPVRVYALRPEGQAGSPIATAASESSSSPPSNAPRLSIVVLPFTNLSDDREQQYFADGITEDLTTDLSRIAGMLVISRNTAFTYQGKRVDTKQIGHELAVRYVLEGSVRRSGNQVRVNAQLIDADTDAHLWAERFNGDASDLFALQDEVTSRIANALGVELIAAEAARPTGHPDALDHTLRGRAALLKPETPDTFAEAISGSLPRPRGGVAQSQCRTRQPRPDEGDVGTIALGGHVARCENCANTVIAYNSCRNRHCPKCQAAAAKKWLAEREAELLPVGYFHLVFTLPGPIADIAYHNKATIYGLLFTAAAEATLTIAADPKASWRQDRHYRCAPWLGLGDDPSSACAHDRAGRRHFARWHALGVVPPEVLSAGVGSLTPIPTIVPGQAPRCSPGWTPRVLRRPRRARRAASLGGLPRAATQDRVGGLRQEAVRWTTGRARLSVALHPPRRHLQSPTDLSRPDWRHLHMEGLPGRAARSV